MTCSVRKSWRGRTLILAVEGAVDMLTAQVLKSAIAASLGEKPNGLLVDLGDTDFLASSGIRVLLWGQEEAARAGIGFGVAADRPATSRPITLLGLAEALNLHSDVETALAALSGSLRAAVR